ncbi:MAG: NTE family protein rssA [Salinarimonadaceae bacterium]|nr:MAG: NTE family protein rssA [Salinarimonadaceae bacterium]
MMWDDIVRAASGIVETPVQAGTNSEASQHEPQSQDRKRSGLRIGLALGGGAARGWSHIGVLRALIREGVEPDVVTGASIGAVVGGCYVAGKLDELEDFARSLTTRRVLGLLDFKLGASGLIGGDRLRQLLEEHLGDRRIEDQQLDFTAIATECATGHEIWLSRGRMVEAIRASYALPGIIDPVRIRNRLLIDGSLVNPIPITTARARGADLVICVNLNGDARFNGATIQSLGHEDEDEDEDAVLEAATRRTGLLGAVLGAPDRPRNGRSSRHNGPGLARVMIDAFNITQDRIARSRLAGDPPDLMISPKLSKIGLFDFQKAAESIALGEEAATRALPDLRELLDEAGALADPD